MDPLMGGEHQPIGDGGSGVWARIEAALQGLTSRLERMEDKLDVRMTTLDGKVDGLSARQDRLEGRLDGIVSVVRWAGPLGVAALIFGLFAIYGLLPFGPGS
jgi:hypothetical protein